MPHVVRCTGSAARCHRDMYKVPCACYNVHMATILAVNVTRRAGRYTLTLINDEGDAWTLEDCNEYVWACERAIAFAELLVS
jgi:hypothetical protein